MPISNAPFFKYAFAQSGDKTAIPQEQDAQGRVSYQIGFGGAYSKDPAADGYYILRDNFNQILFDTTNAIRQQQINGGNLWSAEIANNGGYPAGAVVMVKMQLNGLADGSSQFVEYLNYYQPVVSLIDGNTDEPVDVNLRKSWWVLDGVPLFGIIIGTSATGLTSYAPSGYFTLDRNPNDRFNFTDYPRVKRAFDAGYANAYFRKNDANTFSVVDVRGRFPRLWSNGASIDSGRAFANLQNDAIRNISGSFYSTSTDANRMGLGSVNNADGVFNIGSRGRIGFDPVYFANDLARQMSLSANRQVPTANENRPYNFNVRMYIKI